MRCRAIRAHAGRFPVTWMCQALAISSAGYYAWASRRESHRGAENRQLVTAIRVIHAESRQTYGAPGCMRRSERHGHRVGEHRGARLMRARTPSAPRW